MDVVGQLSPFQVTTVDDDMFIPETVNVNAGPPAYTDVGLSAAIFCEFFRIASVAVLPVPAADNPEQPMKLIVKTMRTTIEIPSLTKREGKVIEDSW